MVNSDKLALTDRVHAPLLTHMAAWLEVGASNRVLDAGCGAGGMTALLAQAAPGGRVAALDVAEAHLHATRARTDPLSGAATISFHVGSAEALPFADRAFDLVWCSHVLHGFRDPKLSLREFRRVLKPEGRLAVREDFPVQRLLPFEVALTRPGLEDRICAFYAGQYAAWHNRPAYTEGWLAMLREAGFERVTAKTFLLEQLPPFDDEQTAYLGRLLASWREDDDLRAALEPEDQAALAALTDPQGATYALTRSDLYLLEAATVYLGWA